MKIISVEYKRLRTFGNYENEAIGATAFVGIDEDPVDVMNDLKSWVNDRLGLRIEDRENRSLLSEQCRELRARAVDAQEELNQLKSRRDSAVALLQKHGVNTEELEEIPF